MSILTMNKTIRAAAAEWDSATAECAMLLRVLTVLDGKHALFSTFSSEYDIAVAKRTAAGDRHTAAIKELVAAQLATKGTK